MIIVSNMNANRNNNSNNESSSGDSEYTSGYMCKKCGFYNQNAIDKDKSKRGKKPTPTIPNGLESFLLRFTVSIIEQKPTDLDQFAFEYFDNIRLKNSRCKLFKL